MHDIMIGHTKATIGALGDGYLEVSSGAGYANYDLRIYNWFNASVGSGVRVICGYCATANKWYIVAADCTT